MLQMACKMEGSSFQLLQIAWKMEGSSSKMLQIAWEIGAAGNLNKPKLPL